MGKENEEPLGPHFQSHFFFGGKQPNSLPFFSSFFALHTFCYDLVNTHPPFFYWVRATALICKGVLSSFACQTFEWDVKGGRKLRRGKEMVGKQQKYIFFWQSAKWENSH